MTTKVFFKNNPIPKEYILMYPEIIYSDDTQEVLAIRIIDDENTERENIGLENLHKIEFIYDEDHLGK